VLFAPTPSLRLGVSAAWSYELAGARRDCLARRVVFAAYAA